MPDTSYSFIPTNLYLVDACLRESILFKGGIVFSETVKAIKLLSSGKAPGSDAIPAEICKAGGPPFAEKLTELFHIMWRKEAIPNSRMQQLSTYSKGKGILRSVTIIEASLYCQLLGRSLLGSY